MFENFSGNTALLITSVGGLVFAVWLAAGIVWMWRRDAQARRLGRRMGIYDPDPKEGQTRVLRLWRDGEEATTLVPSTSQLAILRGKLRQVPHDAGWDISGGMLVAIFAAATAFTSVMGWAYSGSVLVGGALAFLVIGAMWLFVQHQIGKRTARFEKQFEDALHLVARSLRAGQPLLGAFQLVSDEMDDPVSTIFNDICQQQALGVSLDEAIRRVAAASSSNDLKLFATSVIIQLKTGGNLADMMGRLAHIIHERMRLTRRIRVLTSQTQYSKRVLLVLPFFVFFLLTFINPEYMEPMVTTTVGRYLSAGAVVSMALGTWMMNRMSSLNY